MVGNDLLRCYIKIIPQILKVLLTKPYKRLLKKIKPDFSGSFYTQITVLTFLNSLLKLYLRQHCFVPIISQIQTTTF